MHAEPPAESPLLRRDLSSLYVRRPSRSKGAGGHDRCTPTTCCLLPQRDEVAGARNPRVCAGQLGSGEVSLGPRPGPAAPSCPTQPVELRPCLSAQIWPATEMNRISGGARRILARRSRCARSCRPAISHFLQPFISSSPHDATSLLVARDAGCKEHEEMAIVRRWRRCSRAVSAGGCRRLQLQRPCLGAARRDALDTPAEPTHVPPLVGLARGTRFLVVTARVVFCAWCLVHVVTGV